MGDKEILSNRGYLRSAPEPDSLSGLPSIID
jgi:hypothetical protein